MEAAKLKRTTAKAVFTRYEKRLRTALELEDADTWALTNRYDDFKLRWERVQEAHDAYASQLTEAEETGEAEQWMEEIADRFDKMEIEVGRKLKKLNAEPKAEAAPTANANISIAAPVKSIVKMDRIKFQTFEGDIKKYPEFKAEFMKHVEPQCNKSQQAFVLKGYLAEAVRAEVSNVIDDYDKMWERLDQKYGNTGKLVDAILADVKSISLQDTNDANVLQMINVIEKANRDLERLGEHAELRNSTSISIIEQAMTKDMKLEWVKLVASKQCSSSQKFSMLLVFLEDWRNRLEYMGASIRGDSGGLAASGKTFHAGESERRATNQGQMRFSPNCWLHKVEGDASQHPIWHCKTFLRMSKQERRQLAIDNKACLRCLVTDCPGAGDAVKCTRNFKCLICQGLHNSRLHVDTGATFHANEAGELNTNAILPMQSL